MPEKKKLPKWPFFLNKPWVNSFGKMSIFLLFRTSCFYSVDRRFFVLEYCKRHFSVLYRLKKKLLKWPFGPKPWVNAFGKMSIFRLF